MSEQRKLRKPRTVIVALGGSTLVLVAGAAVAATLPSMDRTMSHMAAAAPSTSAHASAASQAPSSAPRTPAPSYGIAGVATSRVPPVTLPAGSAPATRSPKGPVESSGSKPPAAQSMKNPAAALTYTVKRGDTLVGIAAWFKLHGYRSLYVANWKTVGSNPNLIKPGQRITIAGTHMSVASPR